MKKYSIESWIECALSRIYYEDKDGKYTYLPLKQLYLLDEVNCWRKRGGQEPISMEQMARALVKMKSAGKVERLHWATPSTKNIWKLTDDHWSRR